MKPLPGFKIFYQPKIGAVSPPYQPFHLQERNRQNAPPGCGPRGLPARCFWAITCRRQSDVGHPPHGSPSIGGIGTNQGDVVLQMGLGQSHPSYVDCYCGKKKSHKPFILQERSLPVGEQHPHPQPQQSPTSGNRPPEPCPQRVDAPWPLHAPAALAGPATQFLRPRCPRRPRPVL